MLYVIDMPNKFSLISSVEENATAYFSELSKYIKPIKVFKNSYQQEQGKGVIYMGDAFLFGLLGKPS